MVALDGRKRRTPAPPRMPTPKSFLRSARGSHQSLIPSIRHIGSIVLRFLLDVLDTCTTEQEKAI